MIDDCYKNSVIYQIQSLDEKGLVGWVIKTIPSAFFIIADDEIAKLDAWCWCLTHSNLTANQFLNGLKNFFIFKFLRPELDCYAKFTSCST